MKKIKNKRIILSILLVVALVGVGATVALSLAKTNPVINTFRAAQRDHDTSIEENVNPDALTKIVQVKNDAKNSYAYIRVRFEVSPSDVTGNIKGKNWEKDDTSDFWYYLKPVSPNNLTDEIVWTADQATVENTDTFDVLVYEESCVAPSDDEAKNIDTVKKAFENADKTETTK